MVLTDHEPDEHAVNIKRQSVNDCPIKNQLPPQVLIHVLRVASGCSNISSSAERKPGWNDGYRL